MDIPSSILNGEKGFYAFEYDGMEYYAVVGEIDNSGPVGITVHGDPGGVRDSSDSGCSRFEQISLLGDTIYNVTNNNAKPEITSRNQIDIFPKSEDSYVKAEGRQSTTALAQKISSGISNNLGSSTVFMAEGHSRTARQTIDEVINYSKQNGDDDSTKIAFFLEASGLQPNKPGISTLKDDDIKYMQEHNIVVLNVDTTAANNSMKADIDVARKKGLPLINVHFNVTSAQAGVPSPGFEINHSIVRTGFGTLDYSKIANGTFPWTEAFGKDENGNYKGFIDYPEIRGNGNTYNLNTPKVTVYNIDGFENGQELSLEELERLTSTSLVGSTGTGFEGFGASDSTDSVGGDSINFNIEDIMKAELQLKVFQKEIAGKVSSLTSFSNSSDYVSTSGFDDKKSCAIGDSSCAGFKNTIDAALKQTINVRNAVLRAEGMSLKMYNEYLKEGLEEFANGYNDEWSEQVATPTPQRERTSVLWKEGYDFETFTSSDGTQFISITPKGVDAETLASMPVKVSFPAGNQNMSVTQVEKMGSDKLYSLAKNNYDLGGPALIVVGNANSMINQNAAKKLMSGINEASSHFGYSNTYDGYGASLGSVTQTIIASLDKDFLRSATLMAPSSIGEAAVDKEGLKETNTHFNVYRTSGMTNYGLTNLNPTNLNENVGSYGDGTSIYAAVYTDERLQNPMGSNNGSGGEDKLLMKKDGESSLSEHLENYDPYKLAEV